MPEKLRSTLSNLTATFTVSQNNVFQAFDLMKATTQILPSIIYYNALERRVFIESSKISGTIPRNVTKNGTNNIEVHFSMG
jgi:hypothetical protein